MILTTLKAKDVEDMASVVASLAEMAAQEKVPDDQRGSVSWFCFCLLSMSVTVSHEDGLRDAVIKPFEDKLAQRKCS